ncbi:hypothetical protein GGS26DRAFT_564679 [Hypomontagnella submonticulosa]|nr:hypothetical protein GGS26DRAFT_564679 [Hypomontagnella submonticulosa]
MYSTSSRSDPSAAISDNSRTSRTSYPSRPSYNLDEYLRSPPTFTTERLVASQTAATSADREKKTRAKLEDWNHTFDRASKSRK